MANEKAKSPYDTGRRIRLLAAAIVVAIAAWSGGWYWLAGKVEAEAARLFAAEASQGTAIDCADLDVRGYPFRLEVFCTALNVKRPAEGLTVTAGAFRSAAQVYEPRRIYAELNSPVAVASEIAGPLTFDWKLARASAVLDQPLPQHASISIDDLAVGAFGLKQALAAAHAEAHMRINGPDLDVAWRYDGLVADETLTGRKNLPVLAGDADLTITDGVARAASGMDTLRGVSGQFRRLALLVTPEQGLLVSGPFDVGTDGRLNAKMEVIVVDPAGFAQAFKPAFPDYAGQIDTFAAMPPQAGPDGTPEIRLPVTISDGKVSIGFIPVGEIPPLD
ncbi:MAG: DUF2125 domain-containing protein [Oricola sp.]